MLERIFTIRSVFGLYYVLLLLYSIQQMDFSSISLRLCIIIISNNMSHVVDGAPTDRPNVNLTFCLYIFKHPGVINTCTTCVYKYPCAPFCRLNERKETTLYFIKQMGETRAHIARRHCIERTYIIVVYNIEKKRGVKRKAIYLPEITLQQENR